VTQRAGQILARQITKRCDAKIVPAGEAKLRMSWPSSREWTRWVHDRRRPRTGAIRIIGNDDSHGLRRGQVLTHVALRPGRFYAGFVARHIRTGLSGAGHVFCHAPFANFYEAAPVVQVQEYVDEVALWGGELSRGQFPDVALRDLTIRAHDRLNCSAGHAVLPKAAGNASGSWAGRPNAGFKSTPKELWRTPYGSLGARPAAILA